MSLTKVTYSMINGSPVNVVDLGADSTGTTDSAAAIQAAINVSNAVYLPNGTYKVSTQLTIEKTTKFYSDGGAVLVIAHAGSGIVIRFDAATQNYPNTTIENITFANDGSNTPACFVKFGVDVNNICFDASVVNCKFVSVSATVGIQHAAGYNNIIRECSFRNFTGTPIQTLQSTLDSPNYTYNMQIYGTDITTVAGLGLSIAAGNVNVYGGIIEGCSLGGVDAYVSTTYTGVSALNFFGTYFEGNTSFHINYTANLGSLFLNCYGCNFVFGAGSNNLTLASAYASFDGSKGVPSATITSNSSGKVTLVNTYQMTTGSTVANLVAPNHTVGTATPAVANNLIYQINVNSPFGGGSALILCSHQNGAGDATVSEFFLIRYGNDANNFAALSLGRSAGTDTTTFSFSVDANGYLSVTSSATGNARYMVVSNMRGFGGNF